MRTAVFINAGSRRTRRVLDRIKYDLADSQYEIVGFVTVGSFRRFSTGLKRLGRLKDIECVIVAGGDGTIAGVLNDLDLTKNPIVGILPLGTGNSFARSLGLPLEYAEAMAVIKSAHTRQTALAGADGRIFVNAAAIGMSARTAMHISDMTKRYFGRLAYFISGSRQLLLHRPFKCTVMTAKKTYEFTTHELLVVNGAYYGARRMDNHTSVYKNYLTFVALGTDKSRIKYILSHLGVLLGRQIRGVQPLSFSTQTATVTTTPRRLIHADGEVIGKTPATFAIKPKAVTVLVP
jgi:diacylglycerol kinase (ATP)